jgi:hypothetical protein
VVEMKGKVEAAYRKLQGMSDEESSRALETA